MWDFVWLRRPMSELHCLPQSRHWGQESWSGRSTVTASERSSTIIFSVEPWHSKGTGRSPGSSVECKSHQPVKWNVTLSNNRLDVVLEAFRLTTNTPVALSKLSVKHAMGQSDVAQPVELAMEEHGFHWGNPSLWSNFRMSHLAPLAQSKN